MLVPFPQARTAFAIAIDSTNVYWTGDPPESTSNTAGVMKIAKTGGTASTVYNAGSGSAGALLVDDTSVYFVASIVVGTDQVLKAPKDGTGASGTAVALGSSSTGAGIRDIATDGTRLYFADGGGIGSAALAGGGGSVTTVVNTTGTSPVDPVVSLAIGFPGIIALATDGTNVYYTAGQTYGGIIASDSPLAYAGWLLSVPVAGGTPTIVVPDQKDANGETPVHFSASRPSIVGGTLTWQNGSSGQVYKESNQGGAPVVIATSTGSGVGGDAISDGTNVYYLGSTGLMKVPVAGGSPVELVHDQGAYSFGGGGTFPMAIDDTNVYLIAFSGQGIVRVAK